MQRWMFSVVVAYALFGMATHAHHSIAAMYDHTQQKTIEGVVAQVQFVNPHPFVIVDVEDAGGHTQHWRLEMDNRFELVEIGFTRDTLKAGDRLVVVGSPSRKQGPSLYIRRLDRPSDGFWYEQVGSSPRIGAR